MKPEITLLKKLSKELEAITIVKTEDWSDVKNWIAKATPSIRKFFPDFFPDFQEVCKSPPIKPPRYNSFSYDSMTGKTYGEPKTYFHEENTRLTISSKTKILNFLEGLLNTMENSENEIENYKPSSAKKVFIVHGHDELAKQTVARFLEKLKLEAIILHEKSSGGRTIIEKLEHYTEVHFAIVLLTPDDIGGLAKDKENPDKLSFRARQNVVFELGYMIAKIGRSNVCALLKGNVEKPTDYDGVIYISMDENEGWKQTLVRELKAVNINGNFEQLYS